MKLWSRGLGRTEVSMDFRYYKVIKDPKSKELIIIGNMQDPVTWEFTLKLEPHDIAGILKMLFSWSLLWFAIKNLFRYPVYLFNAKKFAPAGDADLEQKVMGTYEKMMAKTPRKKRGARRTKATAAKEDLQTAVA